MYREIELTIYMIFFTRTTVQVFSWYHCTPRLGGEIFVHNNHIVSIALCSVREMWSTR